MRRIERLLSLGQHPAMPESLSRHVRISNAIALIGVILSAASLPFDLIAGGPAWFEYSDVIALAGFGSCWVLNAMHRHTAARVVMIVVVNLDLAFSTALLGETSRQASIFFALATAPFFMFDLEEWWWLVPLVALSVAAYFVCQAVGPIGERPYSVASYRVYSPILAFAGLIFASIVSSRTNRRAEEATARARARVAASARLAALGEMASGIAHEIRNPLAAITLAADQLVDCKRIEDVTGLAQRSKKITGRISKIVDGLSSFARDASDDPIVTVAVEQIVSDTLELCRRRFVAHAIELSVPTVSPSLVVECRPVQISQILLNLLNNAHDAAEAAQQHWVRLEVDVRDDCLELSVVDSGSGVPRELRQRIFEPFFTTFFTTKGPTRGTGLGLSVSRGLAEAHHGTLVLDEDSAHTRFVLRIPIHQHA
jgi:signal transduction histidine kinase